MRNLSLSKQAMQNFVARGMSYDAYLKMIDDLLEQGKTTGEIQSPEMFNFGKLNRQRMHRLEKTVELNDALKEKARSVRRKMIWLILTEGWCGDAAQNIPIIEKIARESLNIKTRYVLRDESLELMDNYLTNGGRAIPKLICVDAETFEEIGAWGSRPQDADNYFREMKSKDLEKPEMMEKMQRWYLADKEQSIQKEFEILLDKWETAQPLSARVG